MAWAWNFEFRVGASVLSMNRAPGNVPPGSHRTAWLVLIAAAMLVPSCTSIPPAERPRPTIPQASAPQPVVVDPLRLRLDEQDFSQDGRLSSDARRQIADTARWAVQRSRHIFVIVEEGRSTEASSVVRELMFNGVARDAIHQVSGDTRKPADAVRILLATT